MRFEIVGVMHTTIATEAPVALCNVGLGGALVEAPWPLRENSVHTVRFQMNSTLTTFSARVRHANRRQDGDSYLIGLEFLSEDQPALNDLELFLKSADCDA